MTADKFGNDIKKGDFVDFVHFGDHHYVPVKDFSRQAFGDIEMVEVEITVQVPAGAVTVINRKEIKEEPKEPVAPTPREPEKTAAEVKAEAKRAEEFHAGEALAGEQRPDDQIKTKADAKKASK